jgi:hypothetical protein
MTTIKKAGEAPAFIKQFSRTGYIFKLYQNLNSVPSEIELGLPPLTVLTSSP